MYFELFLFLFYELPTHAFLFLTSTLYLILTKGSHDTDKFIDALEKELEVEEIHQEDAKDGNDAFVLKNVESFVLEAPKKHSLFDGHSSSANRLDISKDPLVNDLREMREMVESCPEIWAYMDTLCPDSKAIYDEHLCDEVVDMTYHDVYNSIRRSASAFRALGIKKGDHVAVFGENSAHWLFVDHGIQSLGACKICMLRCLHVHVTTLTI